MPCSVLFEIGLFEEEQEKPTALLGTTEQSVYEGSVRHTIEHPERHVVGMIWLMVWPFYLYISFFLSVHSNDCLAVDKRSGCILL